MCGTKQSPSAAVNGSRKVVKAIKKGAIRKMTRNQKNFLDIFNKYQFEVKSLQETVETKFKKINIFEEKLLKLAQELQDSSSNIYLEKDNTHQQNTITFDSSPNHNDFYQLESNDEFEDFEHASSVFSSLNNSFMEPIIDIHINDDENEECDELARDDNIHTIEGESVEQNVNFKYEKNIRKTAYPVTSKTEFVQLVEKFKQNNNLILEKVGENVFALNVREDDTVLGYQCSIEGCNYMHYLRAQVNRHFKNYHSKTCNHCNQRFKRPIDLLIHLNENNLNESFVHNACR